jgi:hypothetical protein
MDFGFGWLAATGVEVFVKITQKCGPWGEGRHTKNIDTLEASNSGPGKIVAMGQMGLLRLVWTAKSEGKLGGSTQKVGNGGKGMRIAHIGKQQNKGIGWNGQWAKGRIEGQVSRSTN